MKETRTLQGFHRKKLIEELHRKYAGSSSVFQRWKMVRKKYLWLFAVGGAHVLKRLCDIAISLGLLVILAPLMLLIGLLIKLSDGGPILYASQRVGKWGREFRFYKFRTMKRDADNLKEDLQPFNLFSGDIKFKMQNDPRVTFLGKILRKTSMDELPQLWCVLKGDMSLVGPRPPLPEEAAWYTIAQRRRLDVKPGLTCFWQVQGRSEIPFAHQVELDIAYIESQSLWLDLKLIIKTVPAVLFGKGAY